MRMNGEERGEGRNERRVNERTREKMGNGGEGRRDEGELNEGGEKSGWRGETEGELIGSEKGNEGGR